MPIKRINHGRYHSYVDTDTGEKIRSVTKILDGGLPKPALINWSASATADYAIDHWDRLTGLTPSARHKALLGARYAEKDAAARRGTQIHNLGAELVAGKEVRVPDELTGYVDGYVRFLDEFDVQAMHVEAVIVSHQHKYCGTFDLIADLMNHDTGEAELWLLDLKSNRSGIFGETALQLAGYRYADAIVDEDGVETVMPVVDRVGAVHITPTGAHLIPVEAGELQHRQFLYAAQVAEFVEHSRDLVGEPITSPRASTFRLVSDEV